MAAAGYTVSAQEPYVMRADDQAANPSLLTIIKLVGLPDRRHQHGGVGQRITMGILERTRGREQVFGFHTLGPRLVNDDAPWTTPLASPALRPGVA